MKYSMRYILLLVFILSSVIAVSALRANNLHMIELRNKVYEADKNNGDVETALRNLREYIYSHMNTDPASGKNAIRPPIQLKYRYERLTAAEKAKVDAQNSQIYTDAQHYCEQQNSTAFSGRTRVPCIQQYVTSHAIQQQPVPDDLYKFDFVSPRWTPDLAGLSVLVAIASGTLCAIAWGVHWLTKRHLIDLG